ncbi:transcriptional regulator, ArsR family [Kribbella flavida DSM 17836]|uniref:Transcriptional regulator, ArsR family n=1 Tax=Kribbella flavida (strain DSM 17836 / JCM 10339 / NBRC 14399) TaxID=479435 RepID=D2PLH8_KRIFD|nr:winged helix-turn-helix domain-containing protein [Kribbella flavida]ADB30607.1 transcriptional regulator, ArsR family [Kribbella flavida DSM 17836]
MGWWQLDADTLARSRFVVSEFTETVAGLASLTRGSAAHPGERAWLATHLSPYRLLLEREPVTAQLVRAAFSATWIADFLTPTPPAEGEVPFADEVARVRATPTETVWADVARATGGPLPGELRRTDLAARAADLLEWVWLETVAPYWAQRRHILEADIVARTRQLSLGGWAAAMDDLRPEMRWLGAGRLRINSHAYPPRDISGAQLLFVPVTPGRGWVSWDEPHRYALVYPCSGVLAEHGRPPAPAALGRLLGPARAEILVLLESPKSTTQLVALTGLGLGSVGRHLQILLDAHLVIRRRAGRSVLYSRLPAADHLIAAQDSIS